MRAGIYARVSSKDQTTENQLLELRRYCEARGWEIFKEYVDEGVSGAKDRRPALDQLVADAKRRRFDVVVAWALDRIGRSMRHLVLLLEDLESAGVHFVSLREGLDLSSAAGRLQLHILAALSEFERARIQERVRAGLARARQQGKRLGRRRLHPVPSTLPKGLTVRAAAATWGVSKSTAARWLSSGQVPVGQTSA